MHCGKGNSGFRIGFYNQLHRAVHPDDRPRLDRTIREVIQQEQAQEVELRAYRLDGTLRYLVLRSEAILDPKGQPERVVGTVLDITDRKQAEEQLHHTNERLVTANTELARATRLKDEFLANMSHELRTPLNAVLGMAEGLQDGVFGFMNERQLKAIATIERSGRHLLELINDILDLAKIESGKLELEIKEVHVRMLCETSLTFVRQLALKKKIQLSHCIPENMHSILADDRRLHQVLINLLSNAIKFTAEGGSVTLEVSRQADPYLLNGQQSTGTWTLFSVTDTGIGICPENINKLFQPFVQIDSKLNRQYTGTGLGLALVRQIAELHGGDVAVDSALGCGSCFTVRIPDLLPSASSLSCGGSSAVPDLPNPAPGTEGETSVGVQNGFQGQVPLILLAEDNLASVETITSYLENRGYRIIRAVNGQEAIEKTKTHHPDLILMDIQMPEVDGLEAIRHIRTDPEFAQVPILALSALTMPGDRERCLMAGATDYFAKPIALKQLASMIRQHLII